MPGPLRAWLSSPLNLACRYRWDRSRRPHHRRCSRRRSPEAPPLPGTSGIARAAGARTGPGARATAAAHPTAGLRRRESRNQTDHHHEDREEKLLQ
jgi:hypothetical protein